MILNFVPNTEFKAVGKICMPLPTPSVPTMTSLLKRSSAVRASAALLTMHRLVSEAGDPSQPNCAASKLTPCDRMIDHVGVNRLMAPSSSPSFRSEEHTSELQS